MMITFEAVARSSDTRETVQPDGFGGRLWHALLRFGRNFPPRERYRPERHYMRGPGPKARAKADRADPQGRS